VWCKPWECLHAELHGIYKLIKKLVPAVQKRTVHDTPSLSLLVNYSRLKMETQLTHHLKTVPSWKNRVREIRWLLLIWVTEY